MAALLPAAAASAAIWAWVHPAVWAVLKDGEVVYADGASRAVFGNDGWFAVITACGALLMSAAFLALRRSPTVGISAMLGGLVFMAGYSAATWQLGMLFDGWMHHGVAVFPPAHLAPGERAVASLNLGARGVLGVASVVWSIGLLLDAIIGRRRP